MLKRFVITHRNDKDGLRRLTFAQQGRNTYGTRTDADRDLAVFRGPSGLVRVLTPAELETLDVREVACYDHGDPVSYYINEVE